MEVVKKLKYLGTVLCKHGEVALMAGVSQDHLQELPQTHSCLPIMEGRNVSVEVKRGLKNSILLPTLTYGSETQTWNEVLWK